MAHYSFLHHHQEGTLRAYKFPRFDLSYPDYASWSINMFAFSSNDVLDALQTLDGFGTSGYADEVSA